MEWRTLVAVALLIAPLVVIVVAMRTDKPGRPKDGRWHRGRNQRQ